MTNTVRELFYITHIDNLDSILKQGILSHQQIIQKEIPFTPIYDSEIVSRRKEIPTPNGKTLWDYANLFFNVRNPMLYRVKCQKDVKDIAVLGVSPSVLKLPDIFVTDGNAACDVTSIVKPTERKLKKIIKQTDKIFWNNYDGSKRKIMAECLIPNKIPSAFIISIYVPSHDLIKKVKENVKSNHLGIRSIIPQPKMFFHPSRVIKLLPNLTLLDGDMFFSRAQTLTVSVNTVRVMGKGVASRAKYQFPDVYVEYQDVCRNGRLKMGKPYLYKREHSSDYELADDPESLEKCNATTWFLLFATKKHWRYPSDIKAIEEGLQWIVKNYKKEKIESLALPALGCGLGRLNWKDAGPLMCKYMSKLDIPVSIYLPLEKKITERYLTKEFLLSNEQTRLS